MWAAHERSDHSTSCVTSTAQNQYPLNPSPGLVSTLRSRNTEPMSKPGMRAIKRVFGGLFLGLALSFFSSATAHADFASPTEIGSSSSLLWLDVKGSADGHYLVTANCNPRIYGAESGNIYVSSNYGSTWTATGSSYDFVAVASSSTGNRMAAVSSGYLLVSKNYGTSWGVVDNVAKYGGTLFRGVTISGDGNTLYATTIVGKVLRYSWNSSSNSFGTPTVSTLPNNADAGPITTTSTGSIAYVGTSGYGLMKYNSSTWSALSGTVSSGGGSITWDGIQATSDGSKFVAYGERSGSSNVAFISTNGGSSTSLISSSPANGLSPDSIAISAGGGSIAIGGRDSNDYENLIVSYDDGATWAVAKGMSWGLFHAIFIANTDKTFYLGRLGWPMWKYVSTPDAVTNLSTNTQRSTSLVLTWTPPVQTSNSSSTIASYSIVGSTDGGLTWGAYSQTVANSGLTDSNGKASVTLSGLAPLTSYLFKVTPTSGYGAGASAISSAVSTINVPSAPQSLARQGYYNDNRISFTWTAPSDTGTSQITSYTAEISADGGSTWSTINVYTGLAPYPNGLALVGGLSTRVNYQFRVKANNAAGAGPASAILTGYAYSKITPVLNLASSLTSTTATLTWNTPTSDGGSDINQYQVDYKLSSSSTWTNWSHGSLSLSSTITGLTSGMSYDFRVLAANTIGYGSDYQYIWNDRPPLPATQISQTRSSAGFKSNSTFTTQPQFSLLASNSTLVTGDSRTVVTASVSFGATLIGVTSETATSGVVTFHNLGIRGVAGTTYTITYSSGLLTTATESVTVTPGTASAIAFSQSTVGVKVGVAFPTQPIFQVLDADNNVVTNDETTTVTMSTPVGFLWNGSTSSPSATAVHGVITFTSVRWTGSINSAVILNYNATGYSTITETLTATEGVASTLTRTVRAQDAPIGNPFLTQPVYQVTDAAGNPITSFNGPITISASQGTLGGTKTIDAVNGVAVFKDLSLSGINASQLVILTVTSPGFTPYTGDSIITRPGKPLLSWSSLFLTNGTPSFTITNPLASVAGTFAFSSGNTAIASFSGTTLNINGVGTTTLLATFTPSDTTNYTSGETTTLTLTVVGGSNGITISLSGGGTSATFRSSTTITASVDNDGTVTFFAAGKRIPGCISKLTSSRTVSCSWKPSMHGSVALSAVLNPTSDSYPTVTSAALTVGIGARSNKR